MLLTPFALLARGRGVSGGAVLLENDIGMDMSGWSLTVVGGPFKRVLDSADLRAVSKMLPR